MARAWQAFLRWLKGNPPLAKGEPSSSKPSPLPHRPSLWYYLGGVTLFLFSVQVITGFLLLLYYRTTPEGAYESVQFIMTRVRFGWLIRSIHAWSANLLILSAFVHMFVTYFRRTYRKPRETAWLTGFFLLVLTLGSGFSGYLLPWNELAFFATKVGTRLAGAIPGFGNHLMTYLRGGEEVTGDTLTRFFGFHVAVFPIGILLVLAVHIKRWLKRNFFSNLSLRDGIAWLLTLFLLTILVALFPWELGRKADPFAPAPPGIKPEWYFLFLFQTLKYIPSRVRLWEGDVVGILAFILGGLFWMLVPYLEKPLTRGRKSHLFTTIGIGVVAYIALLTLLSLLARSP
jgi:cytochrome b6